MSLRYIARTAIVVALLACIGLSSARAAAGPPEPPIAAPGSLPPAYSDLLWEDARRHGAKGDGKADDTEALQKAVKAAAAAGKGVLIPPGTYRTSGPGIKIVDSGVSIIGMGGYSTILTHTGEGPAITLGDGKQICQDNKISNLKIVGSNAKSDGIYLSDYAIRYNVEYVWITGFTSGAGIRAVDHNHSGHISRVQAEGNATGISIGDHGQFTDISYSKIFHNKKYGIELTDCNVINIISTQIEKNGGSDGASIIARGVDALNLIGCYNEQNEEYPGPFLVLTKGNASAFCRAVNLVGCRAIGNKKAPHAILLESAQGVSLTGNMMMSFDTGIFLLKPLRPNAVKNISGQANAFEGPLGSDPFSEK